MSADPHAQFIFWHIVAIGAGLLVAAFPGLLATMSESFDAVGSKRSGVEPTRWRVLSTRAERLRLAPSISPVL